MKNNLFSCILMSVLAFMTYCSIYAQQPQSDSGLLIINKKNIKSSTGEKLSPQKVAAILKSLDDPNINTHVDNARTQMNIGTGIMVGGLLLELGSLLTLRKDNLGFIEFGQSSSALIISGAAALLGGVIVHRIGFNKLKSAATDYNHIKSNKKGMVYSIKPIVTPSAKSFQLGINIRL